MENKIGIIGLGYVGLPLARLFSTKYKTIGFDINEKRVEMLMKGIDDTLEVSSNLLMKAIEDGMICTSDISKILIATFI